MKVQLRYFTAYTCTSVCGMNLTKEIRALLEKLFITCMYMQKVLALINTAIIIYVLCVLCSSVSVARHCACNQLLARGRSVAEPHLPDGRRQHQCRQRERPRTNTRNRQVEVARRRILPVSFFALLSHVFAKFVHVPSVFWIH